MAPNPLDTHAELVRALTDPSAYPDRPTAVEHLETHISDVFLTGRYAYKIKKPLDLGFLDFSTAEKRRHYAEEELRINRRLAPDIYLDIVPITGTPSAPKVEGTGAAFEHAVKMLEFSQSGMLEQVLARGELHGPMLEALAAEIARFHTALPPADPAGPYGTPESIMGPALQNFGQLAPLLAGEPERRQLQSLQAWTEAQHRTLERHFAQRLQEGFVRECHGDLHLGNLVLIDEAVRVFDAIEFNPELRWIDVISEVAFLAMDLLQRGRRDLAFRFVNAYLEHTGDYAGVRLLRYYLIYRALVRAKVAAMRAAQPHTTHALRASLQRRCRHHIAFAHDLATGERPVLVIHHGLSGSGKTSGSLPVLETIGAIRIRSDVERKRLHGLPPATRTQAGIAGGIYDPQATHATYERLAQLAEAVLTGGFPVLVDAAFLEREQRDAFRALAARVGVPFAIAHYTAREPVLRERVRRRARQAKDASEADIAVLEHQLRSYAPLSDAEAAVAVRFDTERMDPTALQAQAERLLLIAKPVN